MASEFQNIGAWFDVSGGWQDHYDFEVDYWDDTDIVVKVIYADGTSKIMELSTDYDLSKDGGETGSRMTIGEGLTWDPAETLVIYRDRDYSQEVELSNGEGIDADVLETALDKIVGLTQQLATDVAGSIRIPMDDDTYPGDDSYLLPNATLRANGILGFDADGFPTIVSDLVDGGLTLSAEPSVDHTGKGVKIPLTAGTTLAFGELVYMASTGKMLKALADGSGKAPAVAMAMGAGGDTETVTFLFWGPVRDDSWTWTPGARIYLSPTTAGGLTQTKPSGSGQDIADVGFALSAHVMYFDPRNIVIGLV